MNNEQKQAQEAQTEANALAAQTQLGPSIDRLKRWEEARQTALRDAEVFGGEAPGKLPSKFQPNDVCQYVLYAWTQEEIIARVLKVHFTVSKVTYDIQLYLPTYDGLEYGSHTRVYNVDSVFLQPANERPELAQPAE
jgi:hypothetical protein